MQWILRKRSQLRNSVADSRAPLPGTAGVVSMGFSWKKQVICEFGAQPQDFMGFKW